MRVRTYRIVCSSVRTAARQQQPATLKWRCMIPGITECMRTEVAVLRIEGCTTITTRAYLRILDALVSRLQWLELLCQVFQALKWTDLYFVQAPQAVCASNTACCTADSSSRSYPSTRNKRKHSCYCIRFFSFVGQSNARPPSYTHPASLRRRC